MAPFAFPPILLIWRVRNGEGDSPNIEKALAVKNFRTTSARVFDMHTTLRSTYESNFTLPVRDLTGLQNSPPGSRNNNVYIYVSQSADIMASLCGVCIHVRVGIHVNNFFSKSTSPRDMLFILKGTLSIEDEKLFKACRSVCSFVLQKHYK